MKFSKRRAYINGIKSIPTIYRGRLYRSRLEARWAAFFDLARWTYEYEPYDYQGWIPDFLLTGSFCQILVEVKPIVSYSGMLFNKIFLSGFRGDLLILGCTFPVHRAPGLNNKENQDIQPLGWFCRYYDDIWHIEDAFMIYDEKIKPRIYGLCGSKSLYMDFIHGTPIPNDMWTTDPETIRAYWVQAGNLTQWRGSQAIP